MIFIKRNLPYFISAFLIVSIFFFTRLYNILTLPIFTDEAIYIRWSQIAKDDATWRFISLTDGKQPSFVWAAMLIMKFVNDPLLAGRVVSVFAGFFATIGMFFLGREIFNNKLIGLFSSILYIIFPMALVYDRMALYDSLVGAFAVWGLYLAILLVRKLRLDIALILGMVAGGATLTKTNGFFNIYLLPFTLLLFDFSKKNRTNRLFKWVGLALVTVTLTYGFYSLLRLSPFFHIIGDKNTVFIFTVKEWMDQPFRFWYGNIRGLWDWFITYTTWPVFALMAASFFLSFKYFKEKVLLVAWFLIPFVALAVFGKVLYPRFTFFMILSLLPLAAFSLYEIYKKSKNILIFIALFLAFSVLMFRSDYFILTNFAKAPIPQADLGQYINDWPAGGGAKELVAFLREKSKNEKIYVATEGTFGSVPTLAIEIYLDQNKNIEKRGIYPLPEYLPKDLKEKAKEMPVYFVFNSSRIPPAKWSLIFITKYQKGIGDAYMSVYQVESR